MDVNGLDALLVELRDKRPAILNIIEGFQHKLEQADIDVLTRQEVEAFLETYGVMDRTIVNLDGQLNQARVTTLDLLQQGFPALPERETDSVVLDDLDQNIASIVAARAQFKERVLTTEGAFIPGPEGPIS